MLLWCDCDDGANGDGDYDDDGEIGDGNYGDTDTRGSGTIIVELTTVFCQWSHWVIM